MGRDQLSHVLVTCTDQDLDLLLGRLAGQSADHIVRLNPVDDQQRQAHGLDDGMDRGNLAPQLIRHRRPIRLVLWIDVVTKALALGVEHHGHRGVRVLLQQAAQHVGHQTNSTGRHTGGSPQIRLLRGKKGTI